MNKTILVILHGWGQDSTHWKQFKDSISSGSLEVNIPDLPGFGVEGLVGSNWGIPEYADWVRDKIKQEKWENVILLGHSFGGRIATNIASESPIWLKGLVLYGSPSLYRPKLVTKIKIVIARVFRMLGISSDAGKSSELREAEKADMGVIFRKIVTYDQASRLEKIKVPTLVVWGEKDEEVPLQIGREIQSKIMNSKLIILGNLGHNAHIENPYLFYGIVQNFIKSL